MLFAFCFLLFACNSETDFLNTNPQVDNRFTECIEFDTPEINGCCVTFKVRTNLQPNASFPIHELGIYSNSNPGPIGSVLNGGQYGGYWYTDSHPTMPYYWFFTFCFDGPGTYLIKTQIVGVTTGPNGGSNPNNSNSSGCEYDEVTITIPGDNTIEGCDPGCTYGICWEDMIMDEITGVCLQAPNGNIVPITFSPSLDIDEGFEFIMDALLIALNQEINNPLSPVYGLSYGSFSDNHPDDDCNKGGYDTPGFFFTNSDFAFVEFKGKDDNGNPYPSGTSPFERYGNCN